MKKYRMIHTDAVWNAHDIKQLRPYNGHQKSAELKHVNLMHR